MMVGQDGQDPLGLNVGVVGKKITISGSKKTSDTQYEQLEKNGEFKTGTNDTGPEKTRWMDTTT